MNRGNLRSWLRPKWVLSDVPVSRNWYKTVSNLYKNLFIYFCIKVVVLNRSDLKNNQSENDDIPQEEPGKEERDSEWIVYLTASLEQEERDCPWIVHLTGSTEQEERDCPWIVHLTGSTEQEGRDCAWIVHLKGSIEQEGVGLFLTVDRAGKLKI